MAIPPPATLLRWLLPPCLVVLAAVVVSGLPLHTREAPLGIVSLELCALAGDCTAVMQSWGPTQRDLALLGLGLDILFLLLYPAVFALVLRVAADGLPPPMPALARALTVPLTLAGRVDLLENAALVRLLPTRSVDLPTCRPGWDRSAPP
jgi:hypothetical protein